METSAGKETDGPLKNNISVPKGLKILSVLSMVGSVLIILILAYLGFNLNIKWFFLIVLSIPFALKFVGALKMCKGQESGYIIYMIPSIILNTLLIINIVFGYESERIVIVFGYQSELIVAAIVLTGLMIVFSILFSYYKEQLK